MPDTDLILGFVFTLLKSVESNFGCKSSGEMLKLVLIVVVEPRLSNCGVARSILYLLCIKMPSSKVCNEIRFFFCLSLA